LSTMPLPISLGMLSLLIGIRASKLFAIPPIWAWFTTGIIVWIFPLPHWCSFSLRMIFLPRHVSPGKSISSPPPQTSLWPFPLRPSSAPTGMCSSGAILSDILPSWMASALPVVPSSRKTSLENPRMSSSGVHFSPVQEVPSVPISFIPSIGNYGFAFRHWEKSPISKMNSCPSASPRPL